MLTFTHSVVQFMIDDSLVVDVLATVDNVFIGFCFLWLTKQSVCCWCSQANVRSSLLLSDARSSMFLLIESGSDEFLSI